MQISSAGIVTFKDDIILKDAATIGVTSSTSAMSISSGGVVTLSANTASTSASSGALVVGGGAGVAADLYVGDDLALLSDAAVLNLGANKDVTITHDPDDGIELKSAATADNNPFLLTLQTGETDIAVSDVLGAINFQAPDEGTGTDAILVAAGIEAVSEGDFSSSSNATKLSFKTGASEAAAEKMALSSTGVLTLNGGSGALVIPNSGTIGSSSDPDAIAIASNGKTTFSQDAIFSEDIIIGDAKNIGSSSDPDAVAISSGGVVTLSATTASTSASSGALVVGGGAGVAADLYVGDDLALLSDAAVLSLGANADVTITHDPDDGVELKSKATADDNPFLLTLQTGETEIVVDDILGTINFQAPDEGSDTDSRLVAAGIEAVSEGTFAADNNATKLSFKTGASEAATEKVAISSGGNLSLTASNTELRFYEGSNYVGFEAPSLSADKIWVLPTADGTSNQVLQTDGNGTLSWSTVSASSIGTLSGASPLVLEGLTADDYETTLAVTDPTADRTLTFPNVDGTFLSTGNMTSITTTGTITSGAWTGTAVADGYVADDLTISGGTVNNSVIGGSSAAAGSFTTITASAGLILENAETITNSNDGTLAITAPTTSVSANLTVGGDLTVTGNDITFGNGETISNATEGDFLFTTNNASGALTLKNSSASNGIASIELVSDAAGDAGDGYEVKSLNGTFTVTSDNSTSGTYDDTHFTIAGHATPASSTTTIAGGAIVAGTAGLDVSGGVITLANDETISNATDGTVLINAPTTAVSADLTLVDDESVILGTNSDIKITYDEATNDALEIAANVEGTGLELVLKADQGDDAGDEWSVNVADGGVMTFGNDIASAGTYVTHLTVTPHATIASSSVAIAGDATVGDDLTITGNDITFGNGETISNSSDGTVAITATTTTISGDLTVTGNDITFGNGESVSNATDGTVLINGIVKGGTGSAAGVFTSNGDYDVTLQTGNSTTGTITITDGSNGNIAITPKGTGEVDISKVDIASGAIDGTAIGAASATTGAFTTIAGTSITASTKVDITGSAGLVLQNDETITNATNGTVLITAPTTAVSADLTLVDDESVILGTNSDIKITYDEATNDALEIAANVEGTGLELVLKADQGDDAGDEWSVNVADAGVMTLGNDIASAGTYVTHLTVTPHATIASSSVAIAGDATVGDDLTITGNDITFGNAETISNSSNGSITMGVDGTNQINFTNGTISPETDDDIDLGASLKEFKDLYVDGVAYIDGYDFGGTTIALPSGAGSSGQVLSTNGSNALSWSTVSASVVTVTDNENTNENNALVFTPDGDVDGGSLALESDGNATYNPSTGVITATGFTTGSTGLILENAETITNATDGTVLINGIVKGGTGSAAGVFTSNGDYDVTLQTGNSTTGTITITDGSNGNIAITPNGSGEVDISKVDIDAGAIDGTAIGAASATTGAFTTITASTSLDVTGSAGIILENDETITNATNGTVLITAPTTAVSADLTLVDDKSVILGTNSDIKITYDEATNDALEIAANVEGTGLELVLKADQGDDAGDEWSVNVADGGVMTFGNDIASAGTYVTHLTVTPHATIASSSVAIAGDATVGDDLTITGNDITFGNGETISNSSDGTVAITATTTTISGDLTVTGNDITFGNGESVSNATDGTVLINGIVKGGTGSAAGVFSSNGDYNVILQTGNSTTGTITITDGSNGDIAITPNGSGEVDISKVDIDAGAIDGTAIGAASATTGAFTTITASTSLDVTGSAGIILENDETITNATNGTVLITAPTTAVSADLTLVDDESIILGTNSDIKITYDEATNDALEIATNVDAAALELVLKTDRGDDAGDEWSINVADGGVMTFGNDKASAGTYVTHLTVTPHATIASSSVAIAGDATVGDDLSFTSDAAVINLGVNSDVTLTHVHDTGVLLNSGKQFQFADSGEYLSGNGTNLSIVSGGAVTVTSGAASTWTVGGGDLTLDIAGDANIDADGGQWNFTDAGATHFLLDADNTLVTMYDDQDTGDLMTVQIAQHGATTLTTTDDDAAAADLTMDIDGELVLDAADAAGVIVKINGTSQLSVVDGVIKPTTNNDVDLGTSSAQYKDAFFDGTVTTDVLTVDATATVATSLTVGGGATILTDAQIADDGNFTADINGDITLDANGGEITLSDNNSETGKVIVDMDNTNIKHQYDASNYLTTTLASTGSVTKATAGAGTTDSDYTLDVDGELVLDAADAAGVIMKFNGTSQVSVIDGVIKPTSNNDIDLGTSDNQFKNVYIAGNIDLEGNIDVNGTTNLDNTDIAGTFRMDGTTFDLDASGAVTIESSGAAISIGADDIDQAINIGTQGERTLSIGNGAFAQTIGIGNATGATAVTIAAGTGDLALTSTDNITLVATDIVSMSDGTATFSLAGTGATALTAATTVDLDATGAMTMNSSAGTISIADDNVDQNVNLATGGTRTLAIGINDGTDVTTITSRGNLAVDGATISLDATTSFNIDNTNTSNGVTINTATSGGPISIGHATSETTVNDNLNVTGALLYNSKIVSTKSNGTTLAASESGSVILQSTNSATITLPATVAGLRYTFVWAGTAGQTFNISPNSSDKIMGSILDVADGNIVTAASSGAGTDNKDLQLDSGSQVGDRVTLVADGDSGWYIEEALGSWAFES